MKKIKHMHSFHVTAEVYEALRKVMVFNNLKNGNDTIIWMFNQLNKQQKPEVIKEDTVEYEAVEKHIPVTNDSYYEIVKKIDEMEE